MDDDTKKLLQDIRDELRLVKLILLMQIPNAAVMKLDNNEDLSTWFNLQPLRKYLKDWPETVATELAYLETLQET